ncbi:MAG: hypothetical protein CO184_01870 [Candidatus Zambryskibacteria bacterium CG_4_9_14_3_um_filter_40_16]|uniref:Uncharacterized protein n=2 Tax=Candidatus Zambryskiibacteriota TaxID=1817925 RepID=A0A2H0K664_9BACT|nr:MAG: hypothetical protein COV95_02570 [Candidatus Zambryskibacteria bacterium CG11_big_fil_rev_8_21_14_0_20_40_24]PJA33476.1 MAG: hypothetical protein CO184_01870 [Candidatus Zambryskibacteria bacterium CG_4_9_14_3_um_filter_40_16]
MFFSLPVSVKNSHPLGYWLTPILVDSLSIQTCEKGVFCYGKLGLRAPSLEEERAYLANLDFLGISCERVTDESFSNNLLAKAMQACSSDRISVLSQKCFLCPCGVLAIPISVIEYAKQKTFKRTGEAVVCKVCGLEAKITSVETLVYALKPETTFKQIRVYPRWYQKEVNELVSQIHKQRIPISRVRSTGFHFGSWNIDVEFLWSFLPLVLTNQSNGQLRAVITNQVLRQAVTAYLLCLELVPEFVADLIVSPLIIHPGKKEKWSLDRMRTLGYNGDLLRLLLLSSMGWNRKEANLNDSVATVEHRRFNLLKRVVLKAEQKPGSVQEAMRHLSQQNLIKGLSNVFNSERFDYSTLKGLF